MFLSLLFNKYTWIALILGGLVLTIGAQRVALKHKTSVIAAKDVTIGQMRASVAERDALIQKQNLAVEGWKAAGVANAKRVQTSEALAQSVMAKARQQVNDLLQAEVPQNCDQAISWLKSPSVLQSLSW